METLLDPKKLFSPSTSFFFSSVAKNGIMPVLPRNGPTSLFYVKYSVASFKTHLFVYIYKAQRAQETTTRIIPHHRG